MEVTLKDGSVKKVTHILYRDEKGHAHCVPVENVTINK